MKLKKIAQKIPIPFSLGWLEKKSNQKNRKIRNFGNSNCLSSSYEFLLVYSKLWLKRNLPVQAERHPFPTPNLRLPLSMKPSASNVAESLGLHCRAEESNLCSFVEPFVGLQGRRIRCYQVSRWNVFRFCSLLFKNIE